MQTTNAQSITDFPFTAAAPGMVGFHKGMAATIFGREGRRKLWHTVENGALLRLTASRRRLRFVPARMDKTEKRSRLRLAVKRTIGSRAG